MLSGLAREGGREGCFLKKGGQANLLYLKELARTVIELSLSLSFSFPLISFPHLQSSFPSFPFSQICFFSFSLYLFFFLLSFFTFLSLSSDSLENLTSFRVQSIYIAGPRWSIYIYVTKWEGTS